MPHRKDYLGCIAVTGRLNAVNNKDRLSLLPNSVNPGI
jgi:hypothetical protein